MPIVLIFGAQATKGIVASDHPYVRDSVCDSLFITGVLIKSFYFRHADTRDGVNIGVSAEWCGGCESHIRRY